MAGLRRPGAAQAEGLPLHGLLQGGRPARPGGRRPDQRRPRGQGQDDRQRQADGQHRRHDRAQAAVRADAERRARHAAPEDAAGGDLRRAHARATRRRTTPSPTVAGWPPGRVAPTVELDEIFRAFDAKTRLAFQDWMQTQAVAITGRGRDLNDAFGTLRPFVEDTSVLVKILNGQEPTVRGVVRNTGTVFSALSERQGQLRGLVSNSNRVFATTAARNADLQQIFQALPTFERESRDDDQPPDGVLRADEPAHHAAAPGGAGAEPDAPAALGPLAGAEVAVREPRPGDHRVEGRPPGHGAVPQGAPAAAGRARPAAAPAHPAGRGPRPVPERAQRDLRELRGGDAGRGGREALPAHDEPAEPRGRRRLPEAPADEPAQPVRVPADVRHPGQRRGQPVRDAPVHDAQPVPDGQLR